MARINKTPPSSPQKTRPRRRQLKGERKGDALISVMQTSPHREIDLMPKRRPMPVRKVEL